MSQLFIANAIVLVGVLGLTIYFAILFFRATFTHLSSSKKRSFLFANFLILIYLLCVSWVSAQGTLIGFPIALAITCAIALLCEFIIISVWNTKFPLTARCCVIIFISLIACLFGSNQSLINFRVNIPPERCYLRWVTVSEAPETKHSCPGNAPVNGQMAIDCMDVPSVTQSTKCYGPLENEFWDAPITERDGHIYWK